MVFTSELVFIVSPGAGHLPPTMELANRLLHHDQQLSITLIILNLSFAPKHNNETRPSTPRLRFIEISWDESTMALITPKTPISALAEHHKPRVRDIVRGITESDSVQLAGFVVDPYCISMTDVANEFGTSTYPFYTSGAAMLGLNVYLHARYVDEANDVTELENLESELSVPSYVNPVPVKVLPEAALDKEGGLEMLLDIGKRLLETNGILVNTFEEVENHALQSVLKGNLGIPPVFAVGPVLNFEEKKKKDDDDDKSEGIMRWLNDQPESSVVFLCFGSMGSFNEKQVAEMAVAIERSGHRFIWSLRRRPGADEKKEHPKEYERFDEVLPEGFLERTSSVGRVIGWAPQVAVLSHPSVGGFVSHCGWNSILESIWCGVPVGAWPLYAEQQMNAFQLVVELGMAAEIRMDYRMSGEMVVTAKEIESGIRKLMSDGEIRKKAKDMKEKSRYAVIEGGSSHASIGNFIKRIKG
ncbi:hypothetical protein L1987_85367 [Smallanthus sonchifolius]|uniref:Uncharacterized protein n=1 Tax=Smallanthus sonchifolius TaxID=185202 RepID=A0ACB8XVN7_9ASTR|nr:hypothetical protein L1987_85367 [Smallanthus sonchifolius]